MANKYHFNPSTGETNPCHAKSKPCMYGDEAAHGATEAEARANFEASMATKTVAVKLSKKKKSGFTPTANPAWNQAMQEKGRSSATQSHDSRPNRERTRSGSKRSAIRDQRD